MITPSRPRASVDCRWLASLAVLMLFMLMSAPRPATADSISVAGSLRTYSAVIATRAPAPLVVVLHGNTQEGRDMATQTSWPAIARRENVSLLLPDGLNQAWADLRAPGESSARHPPAGTDDVAFLMALIDTLVGAGIADAGRVYVTGVSNGGAMTLTLACERADRIAAAASVIMNMTDGLASRCHPANPVPMLVMTGTADPLIPFNGGRGTSVIAASGFWSSARTIAFWRQANGCAPADAAKTTLARLPRASDAHSASARLDRTDGSTAIRVTSTCPAGRDVVLYQIDGGGHRMPSLGSDTRVPRLVAALLGPRNHDIDGPEEIWAFFKRFARR